MPKYNWSPVDSSNIQNAYYDAKDNTLHLQFRGGNGYAYGGVTQDVYDQFMAAESKGKWFHRNLLGSDKHPFTKHEPE